MDFEFDLATTWRQSNVALAVVTVVLLVRWFRWRRHFNSQEKAFCHGAILTAIAVMGYSAQLLLNNDPFNAGSPLATAALLCFIYGTLKKPDRIEHPLNRACESCPEAKQTSV